MTFDRFETLWLEFLEGELDSTGEAELAGLLVSDTELARKAADRYEAHRELELLYRGESSATFASGVTAKILAETTQQVDDHEPHRSPESDAPQEAEYMQQYEIASEPRAAPPSRKRWLRPMIGYALAVASTLLLTFAAQHWWGGEQSRPSTGGDRIATLTGVHQARWTDAASHRLGDRLGARRIGLLSGQAVIRFDNGASMVMHGPCDIRLESVDSAIVSIGKVTVRATEGAAGFAIRSPATDLIDWGTEFTVSVEDNGATELHVHEGLVESVSRAGETSTMVHGGHAIRFETADAVEASSVEVTGTRFETLIRRMSTHPSTGRQTVYEGFQYDHSVPAKADGGIGWSGTWVRGGFWNSAPIAIDPKSSVTSPPKMLASQGGSLILNPDDHLVFKRMLAEPVDLDEDGVLYFSFLVERSQSLDPSQQWFAFILSNRHDLRLALRTGLHHDGRPTVFVRGAGQSMADSPVTSKRLLFAGKIMTSRDGPDQCFVQIYNAGEPIEFDEPSVWTIATRPFDQDKTLDFVAISFERAPGTRLDEIRFGTSWSSVLPPAK